LAEFKIQWQKIASDFSYVQIDIMDGQLVKIKNDIKPDTIKNLTKKHQLEIHLMVKDVKKYLTAWSKLKNVKKIIWHYEAGVKDIEQNLKLLKKKNIKAGLAINPQTKLNKIYPLIKYFSTILLLGVIPGKMGQKFQTATINKIKTLHQKYPRLNIEVDGGINNKNFAKIKIAGANFIVLGSYLQKSKNLKTALEKLK
jgi:ribulose-phosphate 3-epimerase